MTSIRRRLLAWLLPPLILTALAADAITFYKAREEMLGLLDELLEAAAAAAAAASGRRAPAAASLEDVRSIWIWDADGELVHHAGVPGPPLADGSGASTVSWQGEDWRVLVIRRDGRTIQAAEPLGPWRSRSNATALGIIMPLSVAAVPLFAVLIWLGVGRGLRPLTTITAALSVREAGSLQPLPETGLPSEVQPLVRALNDLLRRLAGALESQRRFIADAAHGLRTPLTAVQLQLENLERARTPVERAAAVEQLKAGVPRAAALVQQLLIMARLAPDEPTRRRLARVEMEPLVKSVLTELHPLAERRRIDLGLAYSEPVAIDADEEALRIMAGNLVDNALRYTPEGGVVDVRLFRSGGESVLEVTDTGPGIPPADRSRVLRRFQRGAAAAVAGSGLGLAIVDEVVRQHGGTVELGEGGGGIGLRVTVRLPLAAAVRRPVRAA
jgi:two-component system, OmpR family, sensor kinase